MEKKKITQQSHRHYAEEIIPHTKEHILFDFIYIVQAELRYGGRKILKAVVSAVVTNSFFLLPHFYLYRIDKKKAVGRKALLVCWNYDKLEPILPDACMVLLFTECL